MDHLEQYRDAYPKVCCALQAMQAYTAESYTRGRMNIDGDSLFLLLNEYETANPVEAEMEAHRQYLDVMYMVDGSERIYVKSTVWPKSITRPCDSVDDALLADSDSDSTAILLQTGSFFILFPRTLIAQPVGELTELQG
ncbi:MAG: YhcH/YjgK/YiaL family protein [Oscillospiraceae bacterium]|nr:YhcH/YjgK/YiaL family protein [Oscillospiraceae bacterium]